MVPEGILDELEKQLLGGRARWIADLNESFRDYHIKDHTFPLYVRGSTRARGFMLSRFFSYLVMPNYHVAFIVYPFSNSSRTSRASALHVIESVRGEIMEQDLRWAWLLLLADVEPSKSLVNLVQRFDLNELGVALLDCQNWKLHYSNNHIGRSFVRQIAIHKLVAKFAKDTSG